MAARLELPKPLTNNWEQLSFTLESREEEGWNLDMVDRVVEAAFRWELLLLLLLLLRQEPSTPSARPQGGSGEEVCRPSHLPLQHSAPSGCGRERPGEGEGGQVEGPGLCTWCTEGRGGLEYWTSTLCRWPGWGGPRLRCWRGSGKGS